MDIITDNFNNITISQLTMELSKKNAQLEQLEQESQLNITKTKALNSDYIETSTISGTNYDKSDFERVLDRFKDMDQNVRSHEQIHATIGATTSPISYNYQQGPDGKMYAVGGHVRLDTSMPSDPKAAMAKLDQIARAASGPSDLSSADMAITTAANINKIILQQRENENANQY